MNLINNALDLDGIALLEVNFGSHVIALNLRDIYFLIIIFILLNLFYFGRLEY